MSGTRGRFITLEGGEGAGKSTQINALADILRGRGVRVVTTREPGGSDGAEAIRALLVSGATDRWDPVAEALLMSAARRDHLVRTVWPALDRGNWVLCDRFADSTLAYQGHGHGLDLTGLDQLRRFVMGDFAPDLTLILDLPVETGLARAGVRAGGEDRFERMGAGFHHRLRQGFLAIAAAQPDRCAVVDAARPVETVTAALVTAIGDRLGLSA